MLSFNGINNSQVTIVGGLTLAKHTLINLYANIGPGSTTTLGTVTAGKVWRILNYTLSADGADAGNQRVGTLKFNDVVVDGVALEASATVFTANSVMQRFNYDSAPVLTAGQTIKGTTTSGMNMSVSVWYYEEDP